MSKRSHRSREVVCEARAAVLASEVVVTCAAGDHRLGILQRLAPDQIAEAPGEVLRGIWADGAGNSLTLVSGVLIIADDGVTPVKWIAPCRRCRRRLGNLTPSPQRRWDRLVAWLDQAEEAGGRLRVSMPE